MSISIPQKGLQRQATDCMHNGQKRRYLCYRLLARSALQDSFRIFQRLAGTDAKLLLETSRADSRSKPWIAIDSLEKVVDSNVRRSLLRRREVHHLSDKRVAVVLSLENRIIEYEQREG